MLRLYAYVFSTGNQYRKQHAKIAMFMILMLESEGVTTEFIEV